MYSQVSVILLRSQSGQPALMPHSVQAIPFSLCIPPHIHPVSQIHDPVTEYIESEQKSTFADFPMKQLHGAPPSYEIVSINTGNYALFDNLVGEILVGNDCILLLVRLIDTHFNSPVLLIEVPVT